MKGLVMKCSGANIGHVTYLFLFPGDFICNVMDLPQNSDHRMILRSFLNTLIWGTIGVTTTLWIII